MTDWRIVRYVTGRQYGASEELLPLAGKVKLIEEAIKAGSLLELTYLKASDEKSRRVVRPRSVGECRYKDLAFTGLQADCLQRGERRTFRVDRILELKVVAEPAGKL
ncbi:MAG: WYL domain-containing protein [Elusimicrobia bacterium]|nr:WYL domain-containing protein [Elusimicrobiota bacterium]